MARAKLIFVLHMSPLRLTIIIAFATSTLLLGALFAFSPDMREYARVDIRSTSIIAEVVSDSTDRQKGLSGRKELGEKSGMLFLFERPGRYGIWMKGMHIPIDVVWLRDNKIADIEEFVQSPVAGADISSLPVYHPDVEVDSILEVPAGLVAREGLMIGDEVRVLFDSGVVFGDAAESVSADQVGAQERASDPEPDVDLPGSEYFIENLLKQPLTGKDFAIGALVSENESYKKWNITYTSEGLTISGIMNVPKGPVPLGGFPVLILNHGLIHPSIYYSGRGSKREQDFFARNGYVIVHPDYRGLAQSSPNPNAHHDFYVGYSQDVMNVVGALKNAALDFIDLKRIGMWGHSMGGGMAARVMVLRPEIRAFVLFAPISADAEDNFYELSASELGWLAETYGVGKPARALYERMSPIEYFDKVQAAVQLHHGTADADVPIRFSEDMFAKLTSLQKTAEYFVYPEQKHEFIEDWQLAADRSLQFFDRYVKN